MTDLITSTSNQKIKDIRKLGDRKTRSQQGLFLVEGIRIVLEAIQQHAEIEQLVIAPEMVKSEKASDMIEPYQEQHPEKVILVTPEVFRSLSQKDGPQGVAAVIHQKWTTLAEIQPKVCECWVALDEVADPGNLGTIMRTIDGAGAKGLILLDQCTDPYDPTALRGSMGAIFSVPIVKTSFDEFSEWIRQTQIQVIGTSDHGNLDYHQINYPNPLVLLMGSERQGLDQKHFDLCHKIASIPMRGRSDSLNLAVATGIMLYEIERQWNSGQTAGRKRV
jgi:TrmH family RNA methyltransferase